jgi:iron complex transport system permease protein
MFVRYRLSIRLFLLLLLLSLLYLSLGSVSLSFTLSHFPLLLSLRLPRLILAIEVGAVLSAGGLFLQLYFRNPLAEPYLLGVSAGGGLGFSLARLLGFNPYTGGAAGGLTELLLLAAALRFFPAELLILAGVGVGVALSSITSTLLFLFPSKLAVPLHFYLLGSLSGAGWIECGVLALSGSALVITLWVKRRLVNALMWGRDEVVRLGEKFERAPTLLLLLTGITCGVSVGACGVIPFVGLVAPHLARLLRRTSTVEETLLPSILLGSTMTLLADLLARTLFSPTELPLGIFTGLMAFPFFLHLLLSARRLRE